MTFGDEAHLVTTADRPTRQFHRLRRMPLEIQAKGAARLQRLDLAGKIRGKLWIFLFDLLQQVSLSRQVTPVDARNPW